MRSLLAFPEISEEARSSYRRERAAQWLMPVGLGFLEGGFVGVIADKVYAVPPGMLALITAAPMFGNLSSVFWARIAQRRRKVPVLVALELALAAILLLFAFLPEGELGGVLLAVGMVAGRLLIGGFITVRSNVWTLNYPPDVRGRVTSRLTLLALVTMTVASGLGGVFLDASPRSFPPLYLAGAALTAAGALLYGRVRLRGEEERSAEPVGSRTPEGMPGAGGAFRILREDPIFARYLSWQFLLGTSNMMIEPALLVLVSRELGASYTVSILITTVLPLGLGMLTLPLWAAYLDRVHIAHFRSRHSWLWCVSQLITWAGALSGSLVVVALGRSVLGTARGGGMLAWQLGHNDFAHPERAGLYMGLHATLTGVRGAIAPFLGVLLYVGWDGLPGGWGAFEGIGGHLWGLGALFSALATLGFARLNQDIRRARGGAAAAVSTGG